jgi:hypothetical protein
MPWYVDWTPTPSNGWLAEVYIGSNSIIAVGEKLRLSATHRTVRYHVWCATSCWIWQMNVGAVSLAPDSPVSHQTVRALLHSATRN